MCHSTAGLLKHQQEGIRSTWPTQLRMQAREEAEAEMVAATTVASHPQALVARLVGATGLAQGSISSWP